MVLHSLTALLLSLTATTLPAQGPVPVHTATTSWSTGSDLAHGGGCRKSSPPGKCCHAGSKPLHCH